MKAAVLRAAKAPLEIEDIEIDDPGPGEVLLKTVASGICHSDLHVIEGDLPLPPPCVLGHEPAGIVEAIGEGVTYVAPGDHVIACISRWCGVCKFCTEGRPYLCLTSYEGRPGGNLTPALTDQKGEALYQFAGLSSFAEKMLTSERAVVTGTGSCRGRALGSGNPRQGSASSSAGRLCTRTSRRVRAC